MTHPWQLEVVSGPAGRLHADSAALLGPDRSPVRTVRHMGVTDRALVLGSAQPESHVDTRRAAAAGVSVVRRRSGGGAVLVGPGQLVWVDLVIPAGDPLWEPDVGRAFWWLGRAWASALSGAGLPGARVWRGALVRSVWSDRVCFAGRGAGEVTVDSAKVVGMAQRRSRTGTLFQCAVPVVWEPAALLDMLALDEGQRAAGMADLAAAALGVGAEVADRLVPALLDCLPVV